MRVLRSAKWVSCLAASGGLMLLLGGNAWADSESGVVVETDQRATVNVTQDTTTVVTTAQKDVVSGDVLAPAAGESSAAPVGAEQMPVAAPVAVSLEKAAAPVAPAVPQPTVSLAVPVSGPVAPKAEKTQAAAAVPVKTFDLLPVQPVITSSHAPLVNDLAAQLPTAAVPAAPTKVPSPAQPTGVLGALSAQLAGSVVKPSFMPQTGGLNALVIRILMIFLTLLTVRLVATAFGFASRRDGYAHAARSDVAATFNFLFATPSSLSYVTATRQHATHF